MTMKMEFPNDVQSVYEALTDAAFLIERNLALGELRAEYEADAGEGCATIHAVREIRRALPGLLAKLFDPVNVMDMEEHWRARGEGWDGDWILDVRGQPVTIRGEFRLQPKPGGSRYEVSHTARAKIPMLGSQVEKFVLGHTARGAADELEYLSAYLARSGA